MTSEQLRNFHRAQPFAPFEIYVADGRKFKVDDPEFLAYAPGARTFTVWSGGVYEVVDLLLVASLRLINGEGRRGSQRRR